MKNFLLSLLFLGAFLPSSQAARFYVNAATGNDASTGTSWMQAFKTFQKAIEVANNGDEIWLTSGIYRPTKDFLGQSYPTTIKDFLSFNINKALKIYGGFNGTESSIGQRNPANLPATLSGDVDGDDLSSPAASAGDIQGTNSFNVVSMTNSSNNLPIRLDNLLITGGTEEAFLLYDGGSDIMLTNCRFAGNFDSYPDNDNHGTAQFIGGLTKGTHPIFVNCSFDHNTNVNGSPGCTIWAAGGPASATFTNCHFDYNSGTSSGLSIYSANGLPCPVQADNCTFSHNNATNGYTAGGGIFTSAKLTCNNCVISDNYAAQGGGLYGYEIYGSDQIQLNNCSFYNNHSQQGGAIVTQGASIVINGGVFSGNAAGEGDGGAIFIDKNIFQHPSSFTCTGAHFEGNSSSLNGGAISDIDHNVTLQLSKNHFENNSALNGGAFSMGFSENATVSTTLERCLFSNNTATGGNGGAFFVKHEPGITHPSGLKVQFSTIYNNSCSGMGRMAFTDNAALSANEVISWSASAAPAQSEFATSHGGTITVTQSMIQSPDCATAGIIGCTGNIYGQDPLFVNAGTSDFHLQKCSPAVNGGGTSGTTSMDYDNNPRPYNDGTSLLDMGAYEYQAPKTGCVQANCKNITVNLNAAGSSTVAAGDINNNSTGCTLTFQINNQPGQTYNCGQLGNQVATLKATDCTGTFASCLATITVKDVMAPTMLCKAATLYLNASGQVSLVAAQVNNGSTDNCGITNLNVTPTNFTCANTGANTVTLSGSDASGNFSSCTTTVTVKDVTAPTMLCKPVTLTLNASGQATLTTGQINNGSYDNCGLVNLQLSQTTFSCSNVGGNLVTLSGNDASSNTGICSSMVTVQDVSVPLAKCKNIIANLAANGALNLPATAVDNGSADNCSFALTMTPNAFNCGQVGVNTVVLRATDNSGNSSTCAATVTVKDVTPPTALCKNASVILNDEGQGTLTIAQINNGSADACGIATMTLSKTQFNCSEISGAQYVALTIKDVNNNMATCGAYVTVKDNLAPTPICTNTVVQLGSNGTATVFPANLAANSYDNCSVTSYNPTAKVYTAANYGNNNLTITVKDWSGNAATCVSVVTVLHYTGSNRGLENRDQQAVTLTDSALRLYPNPASENASLQFDLPAAQGFTVRVFDLSGRMILNHVVMGEAGENTLQLNTATLAAGVYLLDFQSNDWKAQKRLVVQHD